MSARTQIQSRPVFQPLFTPKQVLLSGWQVLLVWLVLVSLAVNFLLPRIEMPEITMYVADPLLWLSAGTLALCLWTKDSPGARLPLSSSAAMLAVLAALFQIALLLLAGFLSGFGRSPYSQAPHLLALNFWFTAAQLTGLELTRWYLLTSLGPKSNAVAFGTAWVVPWLAGFPLANFALLGEMGIALPFVGRSLLPSGAESLLATYLALVGGPVTAIAYRGLLACFEWFSPVLPNLAWLFSAFIGAAGPAVALVLVRDLRRLMRSDGEDLEGRCGSSGSVWMLAAVVVVFLFWFNTGLFGVRPVLISAVNVFPRIQVGDIAVTRDVAAADVKVGDIVRFKQGKSSMLRRVVEVRKKEARAVFVSQGDNDNIADTPWDETQLEGRLVAVVPKLGWIPIWTRALFHQLFGFGGSSG